MSLQEGQCLGPYRVVELLGSGGMGEVYKVFDFGLAKALAPETPDQAMSLSPTMTAAATQVGMILGETGDYARPRDARIESLDQYTQAWNRAAQTARNRS